MGGERGGGGGWGTRWDNGIVVVVVVVAFVVEGAVGVFRWHWGVSGEGGVLDLLSSDAAVRS